MSIAVAQSLLQPASVEEVQAHVQAALAAGQALEVVGGGTKRFYGRRVQAHQTLSLAGLSGIVDYQPHELILVARPGTPLAELERTLDEAGQMLAFEPPHWGEGATLGGAIACNLSGPRRFKAGAARDHLLGFQIVTGAGDVVRGGGRVVKNVTGYDLPKLMCGSFGTLGVFTELVVKVLPRAETERTVLFVGEEIAAGLERLRAAARSPNEASGLAHLPAGAVLPDAAAALAGGGALTALRVEGPGPSVQHRCERLAERGGAAFLDQDGSRAFWDALRELEPLPLRADERLWRFSVPPTAGAELGTRLEALGGVRMVFDWGGALLWAAVPARHKPPALHRLARERGGHAQVVRHGDDAPREEPLFAELPPGQRRLTVNLKHSFDPQRVLNPGRMYPDV